MNSSEAEDSDMEEVGSIGSLGEVADALVEFADAELTGEQSDELATDLACHSVSHAELLAMIDEFVNVPSPVLPCTVSPPRPSYMPATESDFTALSADIDKLKDILNEAAKVKNENVDESKAQFKLYKTIADGCVTKQISSTTADLITNGVESRVTAVTEVQTVCAVTAAADMQSTQVAAAVTVTSSVLAGSDAPATAADVHVSAKPSLANTGTDAHAVFTLVKPELAALSSTTIDTQASSIPIVTDLQASPVLAVTDVQVPLGSAVTDVYASPVLVVSVTPTSPLSPKRRKVDVSLGNVEVSVCNREVGAANVEVSAGNVEVGAGNREVDASNVEVSPSKYSARSAVKSENISVDVELLPIPNVSGFSNKAQNHRVQLKHSPPTITAASSKTSLFILFE